MTALSRSLFKLTPLFLLKFALLPQSASAVTEKEITDYSPRTDHYQLGIRNSFKATQGKFDAYGVYQPFPEGSTAWSSSMNLSADYRPNHEFEVGIGFSIRENEIHYPSGSVSSTSIGSPNVETRYHVSTNWAHLNFRLGLSLPFKAGAKRVKGDPGRDSLSDDSGSDAGDTGGGAVGSTAITIGAGASRNLPFGLRLALGTAVSFPFAKRVENPGFPTDSVKRGQTYSFSEGLAYPLFEKWNATASLKQSWTNESKTNGEINDGTAGRLFSSSIGMGYAPAHDWKLSASFDTTFPFHSYAVNQSYAPTVSIGATYTGI